MVFVLTSLIIQKYFRAFPGECVGNMCNGFAGNYCENLKRNLQGKEKFEFINYMHLQEL